MKSLGLILAILPVTLAQNCRTSWGATGVCRYTKDCSSATVGSVSENLCPRGNDYQCCIQQSCNVPGGYGWCKNRNYNSCPGYFNSGNYCPGPADFQCCVEHTGSRSNKTEAETD